jgi:hypothetical protein
MVPAECWSGSWVTLPLPLMIISVRILVPLNWSLMEPIGIGLKRSSQRCSKLLQKNEDDKVHRPGGLLMICID